MRVYEISFHIWNKKSKRTLPDLVKFFSESNAEPESQAAKWLHESLEGYPWQSQYEPINVLAIPMKMKEKKK